MTPELAARLDALDTALGQLRETQLVVVNTQMTLAQADAQLRASLDVVSADVREVRQSVGLSMPPAGAVDATTRLAAWHVRKGIVLAAGVGAGAGVGLVFDRLLSWAAALFGG